MNPESANRSLAVVLLTVTGSVLIAGGCVQTDNSFSRDSDVYGNAYISDGTPLGDARAVFHQHCIECHTAYTKYTEEQWESEGYVIPGDPEGSYLFTRIRGSGAGGDEDMPPDYAISYEELEAVQLWISGME